MSNEYQQIPEYTINDVETLRVLTDVRRQNILELLVMQPFTVKEISKRLSIPVSKLYYHVNMLEEKEMIKIVKTQVVSGIIEKTYLATALSYQISEDLLRVKSPELQEQMEGVVLSLMDRVKGTFLTSANAGLIEMEGDDPIKTMVFNSKLALNGESAAEFSKEVGELIRKYSIRDEDLELREGEDLKVFNLFVMSFPTVESLQEIRQNLPESAGLDEQEEVTDE